MLVCGLGGGFSVASVSCTSSRLRGPPLVPGFVLSADIMSNRNLFCAVFEHLRGHNANVRACAYCFCLRPVIGVFSGFDKSSSNRSRSL